MAAHQLSPRAALYGSQHSVLQPAVTPTVEATHDAQYLAPKAALCGLQHPVLQPAVTPVVQTHVGAAPRGLRHPVPRPVTRTNATRTGQPPVEAGETRIGSQHLELAPTAIDQGQLVSGSATSAPGPQHTVLQPPLIMHQLPTEQVRRLVQAPNPQHLRPTPAIAEQLDRAQIIQQQKLHRDLANLALAFPVEGDSAARRLREATARAPDLAAALARGNGVNDKVPAPRPARVANHWPGMPHALAPLPRIWNIKAIRRMSERFPNQDLRRYVLDNLTYGADLYAEYPDAAALLKASHVVGIDAPPPVRPNMAEHSDAATAELDKYIKAGTVVQVPPGTRVAAHVCDLTPKSGGRWRLIHDMTNRDDPSSVNNNTSTAHWTTETAHYHVLRLLIDAGVNVAVLRDIDSAYRTIPVRPSQQCLQAFYVNGVCYASTVLTFGNRAAGFIWSALAALLHWIIQDRVSSAIGPRAYTTHIGDDFMCGSTRVSDLPTLIKVVNSVMVDVGNRSGPDKDVEGTRVIFSGVQGNFYEGSIEIKPERKVTILAALQAAIDEPATLYSCKDLQSLAGRVAYISSHSSGARVFVKSIYALAYSRAATHGRVTLNNDVRQDLMALAWCITRASHISIRPQRVANLDSDASGIAGGGASLAASWLANVTLFMLFSFPDSFHMHDFMSVEQVDLHEQKLSSGLLELTSIVIAAITFRDFVRGSTLVVCSDNESAVAGINCMYSALPRSAQLLKCLAALTVSHDITVVAVHRPRSFLAHVDALSRGDITGFRQLVHNAAARPTPVSAAAVTLLLNRGACPTTLDVLNLMS